MPFDSLKESGAVGILQEISLTSRPCNPACKVIEVRAVNPLREMHKTRMRELDLFADAFRALERGLQGLARNVEARP